MARGNARGAIGGLSLTTLSSASIRELKLSEVCESCGHNHKRLGVAFVGFTLKRRARSSKHLLRLNGGAWAFDARFFEAHRGDFDFVEIVDTETHTTYMASRETFDRFSFLQDLGRGQQVILNLSRFEITSGKRARSATGSRRRLVQLPLFSLR